MKPDWLPDWRDANAYLRIEAYEPSHWAWDFLRRSEKYRDAWKKAKGEMDSNEPPFNRRFHKTDNGDDVAYTRDVPGEIWALLSPLAIEFGMGCLFNPSLAPIESINKFKFLPGENNPRPHNPDEVTILKRALELYGVNFNGGQYFTEPYIFDLSLPIESQLTWLRDLLTRQQTAWELSVGMYQKTGLARRDYQAVRRGKSKRQMDATKLLQCLRALDGSLSGDDAGTIGEILLPDIDNSKPNYRRTKQAADRIKQGKELSHSGYLKLLSNKNLIHLKHPKASITVMDELEQEFKAMDEFDPLSPEENEQRNREFRAFMDETKGKRRAPKDPPIGS